MSLALTIIPVTIIYLLGNDIVLKKNLTHLFKVKNKTSLKK